MDKPKGLKETDTFIVYTPGKVGSSTVIKALASVGLKAHRCYPGNIKDFHYRDAPTITMVRDPIIRVISYVWDTWFTSQEITKKPDAYHFASNRFCRMLIDSYIGWFDEHYRPITGVNVYGHPFPKTIGYKIYSIRGLVLNTHKLSDNLAEALCEFLPIYTNHEYKPEDFTVEHRAQGSERFGSEYDEFIEKVKFPYSFLKEIYFGSDYCNYFFLMKDRKEWLAKWVDR